MEIKEAIIALLIGFGVITIIVALINLVLDVIY